MILVYGSTIDNQELIDAIKQNQPIKLDFSTPLATPLVATSRLYGGDFVYVEFADKKNSYSYDSSAGWRTVEVPQTSNGALPSADPSNAGGLYGVGADGECVIIDAKYGYNDPDMLIGAISDGSAEINPAVVELQADAEYTFRMVDAAHPDGIVLTAVAYPGRDEVIWEATRDGYTYTIVYRDRDGSNYLFSEYGKDPNEPVSFYQLGRVHQIPKEYVETDAPLRIALTNSSGDGWSCSVPVDDIISEYNTGRLIELLVYHGDPGDGNYDLCYMTQASEGLWANTVTFSGAITGTYGVKSVAVSGFYNKDRYTTRWSVNYVPLTDFVVQFSGSTAEENAVCSTSFTELSNAYADGARIVATYDGYPITFRCLESDGLQELQGIQGTYIWYDIKENAVRCKYISYSSNGLTIESV